MWETEIKNNSKEWISIEMRRMILILIEEIEKPIEEMKIFSEEIYLIKIDSIVKKI